MAKTSEIDKANAVSSLIDMVRPESSITLATRARRLKFELVLACGGVSVAFWFSQTAREMLIYLGSSVAYLLLVMKQTLDTRTGLIIRTITEGNSVSPREIPPDSTLVEPSISPIIATRARSQL